MLLEEHIFTLSKQDTQNTRFVRLEICSRKEDVCILLGNPRLLPASPKVAALRKDESRARNIKSKLWFVCECAAEY
jgi:hypothetical protein